MSPYEETLSKFESRMRLLILQFQKLKEENKELYAMLEKSEEDNKRLNTQLAEAQHQFEALKTAKMLEVADGDLEATKARLSKLIRDVNKCITLLTDK